MVFATRVERDFETDIELSSKEPDAWTRLSGSERGAARVNGRPYSTRSDGANFRRKAPRLRASRNSAGDQRAICAEERGSRKGSGATGSILNADVARERSQIFQALGLGKEFGWVRGRMIRPARERGDQPTIEPTS